MTYEQALEIISGRTVFGSRPGLERINRLLEGLGNPHKKLKFVHVAGTNGKGTTSTYIASVLQCCGYKVGLYTSPYVVDFRERFVINGEMISKEELARQVEKVAPIADAMTDDPVTEFTFITALAFNWYAEQNCDIVVLEVGLGGRFDATNAIDCPEAAVITSVALDHTGVLGDTVSQIAFEKAGIVKEGGSVAMYPDQNPEALEVFKKVCPERNAKLYCPDISSLEIKNSDLFGTDYILGGKEYHIPFSGIHQVYNSINALTAFEILRTKGFNISDANITEGFGKARIAARMEILSKDFPLILMDGGHNEDCAIALEKVINNNLKGRNITAIMGMMADKDVDSYLNKVVPYFNKVITLRPENPRSMSAAELAELAKAYCSDSAPAATVEEAVSAALENTDCVVVCGSFYMASEVRPVILEKLTK